VRQKREGGNEIRRKVLRDQSQSGDRKQEDRQHAVLIY
jgi:hypothetical protein